MSGQVLDSSTQANPGDHRTVRTAPASAGASHGGGLPSFLGIAGMIVGLPALVIFWIPVLGWLLMLAGLSLSVAGLIFSKLRERPAGFAIAGIVLNSIALTIHNLIAMVVTIAQGFIQELASMLASIIENFMQDVINAIYELLGPFGALLDLLLLFF